MTPQERQMVDDLFDRLARLETAPRDAAAERAIADGLARSPHAIYPLVQTVLVQDEALKRADARIRELTGEDAGEPASGGFLDSMREVVTGRATPTSVPRVRPNASAEPDPRWNSGGALATTATTATTNRSNPLSRNRGCRQVWITGTGIDEGGRGPAEIECAARGNRDRCGRKQHRLFSGHRTRRCGYRGGREACDKRAIIPRSIKQGGSEAWGASLS